MGGVSAAVSKTAAAPIERIKLLVQNQVRDYQSSKHSRTISLVRTRVEARAADTTELLPVCRLSRAIGVRPSNLAYTDPHERLTDTCTG